MNKEDILKFGATFIAGGVSFLVFNTLFPKLFGTKMCEGRINKSQCLDTAKIVHSYDIEDLDNKVAYCRCWKSNKFPYCDGTHNAHNRLTGDNVGPVCLSRKEES